MVRKIYVVALALLTTIASQSLVALEEVAVIGTRIATATSQLPANVSVVDGELLQRLAAAHVQQVLSQVPGVNYQRGNGQESLPSIRSAVLTGAGACGSVLVMEQAIPVRAAGFCNVNELFDTHFEQAAQIEVVRGANSAFYGSNSLTGSINVELPSSGPDQLALELGPHNYRRLQTALSYGGNDHAGDEEGAAQGRLYFTHTDDDGYRDDAGYQQRKFSWRHTLRHGQWEMAAGLTFTDLAQETAGFIVGEESYRDRALSRQNLDPEAFRDTRSLRAWARMSRPVGNMELTLTPYVRDTSMDFLQHFLPGDPLEQNQQTGVGWQSSLRGTLGERLDWSVGVDAEFTDGELLQSQDRPTEGSAFLRATVPAGIHYDYQVDARQLGAFTHLRWQASDAVQVLAGLRYEHMRYDYDNLALDGRTRDDGTVCGFGGCRYSRPADRQDSFSHWSPKLEIQWSLSDQWRAHLAVADSFRAPQATELYRLQRRQSVAQLDKVRATSVEAGLRWGSEAQRISLNAYQLKQRNLIIRDSDFFNVDGQRTDSSGVELAAHVQFADAWHVRGAASYARHKYASDQILGGVNINGNEVDTAPHWVGNAAIGWRSGGGFDAELELQHQSGYFLTPENSVRYPGHTLLNLRSSLQIDQSWQAGLRLINLTDTRYAERADFTSFTGHRYFPGEPRAVFADLRWQF
ncbi:MAG: TonB-dependent receptor [Gammaproteobacteria bacterium]|nr:TonB-dependent receptor [Gammaproteobacteria bacterium]